VEDAESGVEADRDQGESRFCFQERVEVVKDGSDGVGGEAWGAGNGRGACRERSPVGGDVVVVAAREGDLGAGPGLPVGGGGAGFGEAELIDCLGVFERCAFDGDRRSRIISTGQPVEELGLAFVTRRQATLAAASEAVGNLEHA
jgi:hypothetical protein